MLIPRLPTDEDQRLRCLRTLQILDTPPDPALDAITAMLSEQLGCPIALLTLVDEHRQWFKSRHGLNSTQTPREEAFCAHAILEQEQFLVADARQDERFHDNPLVTGEPRVIFYAGQPLLIDGHAVGTLCVIDHGPRAWTPAQAKLLATMATVVEALLTSQLQARQNAVTAARLQDLASVASSNLLWECDRDLKLTWVGDDAGALFGTPDLARPGRTLWNGHPLDELGTPQPEGRSLHDALRATAGSAGPVTSAYEVQTPSGPMTIGVSAVPVIGRGRECIGWRGVAKNVGPTVQARRRLRDAELADARRRQQMEFLSRVSHELRTPLNAILSFNLLLQQELHDSLAPHQRRWMELVRQGGQHLLALTDDILTLGEHEERALALAPLHLPSVVAHCVDFIEPVLRENEIEVIVEEDTGVDVRADQRALHQVLLNVLGNAVKYSPKGGRVRLRLSASAHQATIAISDEGPGIPADRLHRLFVPFERLGAHQTSVPGSGLGLAIAKALVEAMDGLISADSSAGAGCTIRIVLPLAHQMAEAA